MTSSPKQTPSQTVGPYFAYGLTAERSGYPFSQWIGSKTSSSDHVSLTGRVLDGEGQAISDAMVEIWQSEHSELLRAGTDDNGRYEFTIARPNISVGMVPSLLVTVFMRGLSSHVFSQLYFPDFEDQNDQDPTFSAVPAARRSTLIARKSGHHGYAHDIYMQGENETVFFDL